MRLCVCTTKTLCIVLNDISSRTVGAMSEDCSYISECTASGECLTKHIQPVKSLSVASV